MSAPLVLLLKTGAAFAAAFLAIWVWTGRREPGWMVFVLGSLFHFGVLLLRVLFTFGILFPPDAGGTTPLWYALLQGAPYLLYAGAFGFFIRRGIGS